MKNIKRFLISALLISVPTVGQSTSLRALNFDCGTRKVIVYQDSGMVALNGNKMDDVEFKKGVEGYIVNFAEYAAAGGSRTAYSLWFKPDLTKAQMPALIHQWLNADSKPRKEAEVDACSSPTQIVADNPKPSMLELIAEDAEG